MLSKRFRDVARNAAGAGGLALVLSFALVHCNNGATGVEACRRIETTKCELVRGCPNVAIVDDGDVTACKLFYRDQCLFGVADGADPDDISVEACLGALDRAAACKGVPLSECDDPPALASGQKAASLTGCDVLLASEKLAKCDFLVPPPPSSKGDKGSGDGGAGDGGAGGAGGAGD